MLALHLLETLDKNPVNCATRPLRSVNQTITITASYHIKNAKVLVLTHFKLFFCKASSTGCLSKMPQSAKKGEWLLFGYYVSNSMSRFTIFQFKIHAKYLSIFSFQNGCLEQMNDGLILGWGLRSVGVLSLFWHICRHCPFQENCAIKIQRPLHCYLSLR